MQHTVDVGAEEGFQIVPVSIGDAATVPDASIGNGNIQPAEAFKRLLNGMLEILWAGDIGNEGEQIAMAWGQGIDGAFEFGEPIRAAGEGGDMRSLPGEGQGSGKADAAGCAGDEGDVGGR
jgi:hypothetical protein